MSTNISLTDRIQEQIIHHGLTVDQVQKQLIRFKEGFPELNIDRPATIGDGIIQVSADEEKYLTERFHQAQLEGRMMKFVPASGAASRMFKTLQSMLNSGDKLTPEYFEAHPGDEDVIFTRTFLENLTVYPFFEDLSRVMARDGLEPLRLRDDGEYHTVISYVMEDKGLGLASLPKALIPFHRYQDHCRAPLEEHLVEAAEYTRGENGRTRIHFTISPEHKSLFEKRLAATRSRFESGKTRFEVETSFQKPQTDIIAATPDNQPFLDDAGNPVFRPGGHGALLVNLQELKGDIVFIKNVDNVVPDRLKELSYRYKKIIGGYLLQVQDRIFSYLKGLDHGTTDRTYLNEIIQFLRDDMYIGIPESLQDKDETGQARWLFDRLNRPIRVCGIVKNEGEPGGGPFVVKHDDGTTSLQIVEDAQINHNNARQKEIFESSTHFNPTDLVCAMRDYQGRPFKLEVFRDAETGFISNKSYQGRDLKALELPGLWNGSMAHWISVFVEIPAETFCPVKTVNDLLRDEHRNE